MSAVADRVAEMVRRNAALRIIRADFRMNGSDTHAIRAWQFAVCSCLFHCHSGFEVSMVLREMRFRPGADDTFPLPDCYHEEELAEENIPTDDLINAARVLDRLHCMVERMEDE